MANIKQAKKRVRQHEKNRQRNVSMRSMLRTAIKKVLAAVQAGEEADAKQANARAISVIDRYARKGLIHKNAAARTKSRLVARIKGLSSAA